MHPATNHMSNPNQNKKLVRKNNITSKAVVYKQKNQIILIFER